MRWLLGIVLVALLGTAACTALLPDRFAVNAPFLQELVFGGVDPPSEPVLQGRMQLPEGFQIGLYAEGIRNARFLRFAPDGSGNLLVSSPRQSAVILLEADKDGDGKADEVRTLLSDLERPHGMDFRDGWLYVAEASRVRRVRYDARAGRVQGELEPVVTGLPSGGNHWTRTVRFGPDGWMYVSIGSSCNVCIEEDPRRAAIVRYRPDGSGEEIFATGLRNAVGFDFHPQTGEIWATDNGRDLLGDDFPPCEFNKVVSGGFYGWPLASGDRVPDPDFGDRDPARVASSIPPEHGFTAHTAPLGMTFYRGTGLPERYRRAAFAALHGSWNRTRKSGYRVVMLEWDESGRIVESDFLTGFEVDEDVIGRPVDVAEGPDGALYVSDDFAGAVYRIWHTGG